MQLPPPSSTSRQVSSPTLDQYHVASRSPEQRRASMISPAQANFTLPPIHSLSPIQADQAERPSSSYGHASVYDHSQLPVAGAHASYENIIASARPNQRTAQETLTQEQIPSQVPAQLQVSTSNASAAKEELASSPARVKQEAIATPPVSSPIEAGPASAQPAGIDVQSLKTVASLKNEHGPRTHSPLRDSSVPVQSTETTVPEPTVPKKRPAPSKTKKGTATTTMKKAPPAKKRKVEPRRSVTPSSHASKPPAFKTLSSKGTPADSSPAPSTRSQSAEPDDEPYDDEDMEDGDVGSSDDVYCICRKPDNGTFMIGCDGTCDDWFHGKCVGIEERDKNLIDKYVCPNCTKAGAGETTWKRICRRRGCRLPARVGKTKGGKDGSKYCSEECGVMYFREMVARTRGREDIIKHRSNRRKGSIVSAEHARSAIDDDLGARGGILATGELKSLINTSKTAEDFKKLGEGVLSPPATPDSKTNSPTTSKTRKSDANSDFTESETQALASITRQKDEARRKHQMLKDRVKFVSMVKQAGTRMATERELKPKDYCGYDSRLEWSEEQFAEWRNSSIGRQAFELDTLARENSGTATGTAANDDTDMENSEDLEDYEICDRKKCARHLEWSKLAMDDVRFEISDNGDHMRALDKEEKEIRERAALRGKAGSLSGKGSVEVHGLGISIEDGPSAEPAAPAEVPHAMAVDSAA